MQSLVITKHQYFILIEVEEKQHIWISTVEFIIYMIAPCSLPFIYFKCLSVFKADLKDGNQMAVYTYEKHLKRSLDYI